jgi:hypothetical protein
MDGGLGEVKMHGELTDGHWSDVERFDDFNPSVR